MQLHLKFHFFKEMNDKRVMWLVDAVGDQIHTVKETSDQFSIKQPSEGSTLMNTCDYSTSTTDALWIINCIPFLSLSIGECHLLVAKLKRRLIIFTPSFYHPWIITETVEDALVYFFCVLEVKCSTPMNDLCVRKQRADSGGLGLGLLSFKTLSFKHSLLSFSCLGRPM